MHLVGGAARVEADATVGLFSVSLGLAVCLAGATYQRAHDERLSGLIVVDTLGDDVPTLAISASAGTDLEGQKVRPEVAGEDVDEDTAAIASLEL